MQGRKLQMQELVKLAVFHALYAVRKLLFTMSEHIGEESIAKSVPPVLLCRRQDMTGIVCQGVTHQANVKSRAIKHKTREDESSVFVVKHHVRGHLTRFVAACI